MKQVIFTTVHGSHLYGLAHEGSDKDFYVVYEGADANLKQSVESGIDIVRGDIGAFLTRALSGSHQSVEAIFSKQKVYAEGMEEKWGAFFDNIRITGGDVFAKYERTIKKFCYGDEKRRRHAVRLYFNLVDLRRWGRFDPTLTDNRIYYVKNYANRYDGDGLKKLLLEGK